jgi:hypothetical protein
MVDSRAGRPPHWGQRRHELNGHFGKREGFPGRTRMGPACLFFPSGPINRSPAPTKAGPGSSCAHPPADLTGSPHGANSGVLLSMPTAAPDLPVRWSAVRPHQTIPSSVRDRRRPAAARSTVDKCLRHPPSHILVLSTQGAAMTTSTSRLTPQPPARTLLRKPVSLQTSGRTGPPPAPVEPGRLQSVSDQLDFHSGGTP